MKRWSLFAPHANMLGCWCVLVLCLLAGLLLWTYRNKHWKSFAFSSLVVCLISFVLAATRSRGSMIAYVVALFAFCFFAKDKRAIVLSILLVFIYFVSMFFVDGAVTRAASTFTFDGSNGSINGHLSIMRAACSMIYDHPFSGIGYDWFGIEFNAWYREDAGYKDCGLMVYGALNDVLHFGAEKGLHYLFLFMIPFWAIFLFLYEAVNGKEKKWERREFALALFASFVAFLICSAFCLVVLHDFVHTVSVLSCFFILLVSLAFVFGWKFSRKVFIKSAVFSFVFCFVLYIVCGLFFESRNPAISYRANDRVSLAIPRNQESKAQVFVYAKTTEHDIDWYRNWATKARHYITPLASASYSVVLPFRDNKNLEDDLVRYKNDEGKSHLIVMEDSVNRVVDIQNNNPKILSDFDSIVFIDPAMSSPPKKWNLDIPLLFVYGKRNDFIDLGKWKLFMEEVKKKAPQSRILELRWNKTWSRLFKRIVPEIDEFFEIIP